MKRRSFRVPVALAVSALGTGGLCVILSCGDGTAPVPTCPGLCLDGSATDSGPPLESAPEAESDGPVDAFPDFIV